MTIAVTPARGDDVGTVLGDEPSHSTVDLSPLGALRDKREKILEKLLLDKEVPRWHDEGGELRVFVRYKPASVTFVSQAFDKRRQQKKNEPEWALLANCDILIESCVGVYGKLDGDEETEYSFKPGSPNGPLTRMDPDLGESLGVTLPRATDVVRKLFFTEGDLIAHAQALSEWSGIVIPGAEEDFLDN